MDKFIKIYENVYDKELCEEVIQRFEVAHASGFTMTRNQENPNNDKLSKDDRILFVPAQTNLDVIKHELGMELQKRFWHEVYDKYTDEFSVLRRLSKVYSSVIKIQKTEPGQGFHGWHYETDAPEVQSRILTWTAYLNDDFEAGETEFLYQHYRYKPKQGDVIIFPAGFTHTHRGNPPINGTKYIMTGWVTF